MPSVTHHGRTTAYEQTERNGPTILCVHGSGGTNAIWKAQRARLNTTVTALDFGGHGASDRPDAEPGPDLLKEYVHDVAAVADAVDPDLFIGHSLGGAVLLEYLIEDAVQQVPGIVIGAGPTLPVAPSLLELLEEDFEAAVDVLHGENRLFHAADDRTVERSKSMMHSVGKDVTYADFLTCRSYDVTEKLDQITVPIQVIAGTYDRLTPRSLQESLVEGVPNGRLTVVDEAAHMVMIEQPQAVNQCISSMTGQ